MPTRKRASMKFKQQCLLEIATMLLSLMIIASCSTGTTAPPPLTGQAPTSRPLACTEFAPMRFNPGKPDATRQDVLNALMQPVTDPNDPLAWVRGVVGDTKSTRTAISNYAAARRALGCDPATP